MPRIKVICGPGGSGKDTAMDYIIKNNFLKDRYILDVKQYTTRQRRLDEDNDKRHHFITEKEYEYLVKNNLAFACEEHSNYHGTVRYCYNRDDFSNLYNKDYIIYGVSLCVLEGFIEEFGTDIIDPVYITAPAYVRLSRMIKREADNSVSGEYTDPIIVDASKRIVSDSEQYKAKRLQSAGIYIDKNTILNTGTIEEAVDKLLSFL